MSVYTCPHCRAEHARDPRNTPGVVDLCIVCGAWCVFLADGARGLTPREALRVAHEPRFQQLHATWARMQLKLGMVREGTFTDASFG